MKIWMRVPVLGSEYPVVVMWGWPEEPSKFFVYKGLLDEEPQGFYMMLFDANQAVKVANELAELLANKPPRIMQGIKPYLAWRL